MTRASWAIGVVGLVGTLTFANVAHADDAAAQALFNDAKRMMKAGDYANACPKLAESQRLDAGVGTLFHLAECNEHIGKLASAWAEYLDVAAQSSSANQAARERVARARAAALEPRLPKLTIVVAAAPSGLEVKRDGGVVGAAQWNAVVPVDPGEHTIEASAPGKKSWTKVAVVTASGATVRVEVPALEDIPASPVAAATPDPIVATPIAPDAIVQPEAPLDNRRPRARNQRIVGGTLVGVGIVGFGVGTALGLISKSKHDDADDHCAGNVCDPTGVSQRNDARSLGNGSTIAFVAGGALAVAGAIVIIAAPSSSSSNETARLEAAPMAGADRTGVLVSGRW